MGSQRILTFLIFLKYFIIAKYCRYPASFSSLIIRLNVHFVGLYYSVHCCVHVVYFLFVKGYYFALTSQKQVIYLSTISV